MINLVLAAGVKIVRRVFEIAATVLTQNPRAKGSIVASAASHFQYIRFESRYRELKTLT
jgi:hypothetical protein